MIQSEETFFFLSKNDIFDHKYDCILNALKK